MKSSIPHDRQPGRARNAREPVAAEQSPLLRYGPIAFLVATLVYLLAFYGVELAELTARTSATWRRYDFLQLLLVPEALIEGWFGADGSWTIADRVPILLAAVAIWTVAALLGWLVLRAAKMSTQFEALELLIYSAGVGASLVSLYVLGIGLAGGLHARWLFLAPSALVVIAAVVVVVRSRRVEPASQQRHEAAPTANVDDWPRARWLWWMLPFCAAITLGGMLPPVEFDVREYHLEAPKEFYLAGRISFLPHNVYASMPLASEMLSLLAMAVTEDWWRGALVGKTAIALFAPFTALALFAFGRRWFSTGAGVVAALVYISIPWIALVSTSGLIEGASAFYLLLAVDAMLRWRSEQAKSSDSSAAIRYVLLAGFLAGSAVAVKYPAALFVFLPLASWIVLAEGKRAPRALLLFVLAAAVACGPWFTKNWVQTSNPTYPLLYGIFGGETRTDAKNAQWQNAHDVPNFSPADLAKRVADMTLRGAWLSALVVPLAVAALVWRRRMWPVAPLAIYLGFVVLAWWLFTHRIERFWVPALPVAALLAGAGATWNETPLWRRSIAVLLVVGLVANFLVVTSGVCGDISYFAPLAELRSEPHRLPPWTRYLNEHRQPGEGVLSVGDAAVFDLAPPVVYNTAFDDNQFELLVRAAYEAKTDDSLTHLHAELASRFAFVYVNWAEIARYRSPSNYGYSEFVQPDVFEFLVERDILASPVDGFDDARVAIYPVRPLRGTFSPTTAPATGKDDS